MIFEIALFAGLHFIRANEVEITLDSSQPSVSLSELDLFPKNGTTLKFKIKGCKDGGFSLTSKTTNTLPKYQIRIGGWSNTRSEIVKVMDNGIWYLLDEFENTAELHCTVYREFWVTWDQGSIYVGRGNAINIDVFLSYFDPCPYKIQEIEIAVDWGTPNSWLIDTAQPVYEPSIIPRPHIAGFYNLTNCPSFKVLNNIYDVGRIECVATCLVAVDCAGVHYDDVTKTCETVSNIAETGVVSSYLMMKP